MVNDRNQQVRMNQAIEQRARGIAQEMVAAQQQAQRPPPGMMSDDEIAEEMIALRSELDDIDHPAMEACEDLDRVVESLDTMIKVADFAHLDEVIRAIMTRRAVRMETRQQMAGIEERIEALRLEDSNRIEARRRKAERDGEGDDPGAADDLAKLRAEILEQKRKGDA